MRSWIEQAFGPAIAFAHEQAPLVQAMLAILPKFYSLGNDAEAGPMRWAGNLLPLEPRLHLFEACLERMRSHERREGQECVRTCKSRWSPFPTKKTITPPSITQ